MEDFYKHSIMLMEPLGFWPKSSEKKLIKKCISINFIILLFGMGIMHIYDGIRNYERFEALCFSIVIGSSFFFAILKISIFFFQPKLLKELIDMIIDLDKSISVYNREIRVQILINIWKKSNESSGKVIICAFSAVISSYVLMPLITIYSKNEFMLIYQSSLSVDLSITHNYISLYLVELAVSIYILIIYILTDIFFFANISYIRACLIILSVSLRKATEEAIEYGYTTPLFGEAIEYHKKIIRTCKIIQDFFNPVIFGLFVINLYGMCIMFFLIAQNPKFETVITYSSDLTSALLQMFIYCYFGQILQTGFEELTISAFHDKWTDAPVSYQKNINILQVACSKSVTLTANKIIPVNLQSYAQICKTSFSYLTMLQSMAE